MWCNRKRGRAADNNDESSSPDKKRPDTVERVVAPESAEEEKKETKAERNERKENNQRILDESNRRNAKFGIAPMENTDSPPSTPDSEYADDDVNNSDAAIDFEVQEYMDWLLGDHPTDAASASLP